LPYGYYTFLRLVVCGSAALAAFESWQEGGTLRAATVLMILVAILFNPIIPIYLKRQTWFYLDICTAIVFVAYTGLSWWSRRFQARSATKTDQRRGLA
jgi:hypothetical protein